MAKNGTPNDAVPMVGDGEVSIAEQPQVEDGARMAGRADQQPGDQAQTDGQRHQRALIPPPPLAALHDPEHDQRDPGHQDDRAEQVGDGPPLGIAGLLDGPQAPDEADQPAGEIHPERPSPPSGVDEEPPDRRTQGRGYPADTRPQGDRGGPALRRERSGDQGGGHRRHHRRRGGLDAPGADQERHRRGEGAGDRRHGEAADPGEEDPLAPDAVAPCAGRRRGGQQRRSCRR